MGGRTQIWCVALLCLASVAVGSRMIQDGGSASCPSLTESGLKSLTLRSPVLTALPGVVNNKYYVAQAPKGHFGIKNLFAELVDENGVSVPLSEVYLHHWVMMEIVVPKKHSLRHVHHFLKHMRKHNKHGMYHATDLASFESPGTGRFRRFRAGPKGKVLNFLGKGGETRQTDTSLPAPYAEESGNPEVIPEGFESVWILNVHGLDTRGAVDPIGCSECRCDLYNVTTGEDGKPLPEGYLGGLRCCGDDTRCALKEGYNGVEKSYHLQYTWEYVEWDDCVVPLQRVGIDITNPDGLGQNLVEFTVDGCGDSDPNSAECVDTRVATLVTPRGGDVAVISSHLHSAALNATLYGEDGRVLCETSPIYGQGHEAGNEKGYIVGITSCKGTPGSGLKIVQGEKLKYVVQYTKVGGPHTGLMALVGARINSHGVAATY